ncbi:MAG: META domain-containing protein [Candidatus Paceibacterota bacterium]|jgi:heat shock protein HslJ
MKKTHISIIIIILTILIAYFYLPKSVLKETSLDVKNVSYVIDGQEFKLVDGIATKEIAPNSASKQTVRMFGEPVYGDLNADGINDAAVMLTSDSDGSGTFFYAVLAIANGNTYKATNALILGDRIAPQTVEIRDGRAVYNYAERKSTEPMTARPSIGKSLWIHYNPATGQIGEWVKDFEGEADINKMSLGIKKWNWIKTQMNDGKVVTPKKSGEFTLVFNKDGSLSAETDCNRITATYIVNKNLLSFDKFGFTKMYCEGSQEDEFAGTLRDVNNFFFTSKGELVLEIKMDSGVMIFR